MVWIFVLSWHTLNHPCQILFSFQYKSTSLFKTLILEHYSFFWNCIFSISYNYLLYCKLPWKNFAYKVCIEHKYISFILNCTIAIADRKKNGFWKSLYRINVTFCKIWWFEFLFFHDVRLTILVKSFFVSVQQLEHGP